MAAGYATRLYPLTENMPKPLLKVGEKSIIEHIIDKLDKSDVIDKIYIVTNGKFEKHFTEWANKFDAIKPIEIVNDNTKTNEDRLGALGDINYVIDTKKINSDLIVIAGDNIFEFSLMDIINLFEKIKSSIIAVYDVNDFELAKKYGVVGVKNNIVVNFEEKPAEPKSTLISTGIYLFPKKIIKLIKEYISEGNNPDKTGSFIEWLYKRDKVYAYVTHEPWYDIGDKEQLSRVREYYKGKK